MISLICIYLGGVLTLLMAILHTRYYKIFNWKTEFKNISTANTRIFYTLHIALLLMFFIIAATSIVYANELSRSEGLANGLNILFAAFWFWRLIWQFVYFKKQKRQKTHPVAIVLSTMFLLLAVSYSIPVVVRFFN